METTNALAVFAALSQETRLRIFRLLIEYGHDGAPAGKISEELGIPHNTLSFHLTHLNHAGLVSSQRNGRSIQYMANCDLINDMIDFLAQNCCIREASAKDNSVPACIHPKECCS